MEQTVRYENLNNIDINQLMIDIYFRSYLFEYKKINNLNYSNENTLIYLNSNSPFEVIKNDIENINPNILHLFTNKATLKIIFEIIPLNINTVYTGDLIIRNYHLNKNLYCWYFLENDNQIIKYLETYSNQINQMIKIKNHFGENCLYVLALNKFYKSIQFILDVIKLNHIEMIELMNSFNINNKTIFAQLVEFGFENVDNYYDFVLDDTLQLVDNNKTSILWECAYRKKDNLLKKIIPRVSNNLMDLKDIHFNISPREMIK